MTKNSHSAEETKHRIPPEVLFGSGSAMERIKETVQRVAKIRVPILIRGESGTGKEAIADFLHQISDWADHPLVKVNCAAIPGALLESELFGYERGAFTGANTSRPGKFEQANEGTLVLDEIADIDSGLQAKLLHALQDGSFSRIGGMEERRATMRVVSITNREIEHEIARGSFREDLYYRINVVNMKIPPLRDRLDDLEVLTDYFLNLYGKQFNRAAAPLPPEILARFRKHSWPGNIRELENYLKRYVILGTVDGMMSELQDRLHKPGAGEFNLVRPADFSLKKFARLASMEAERFLILEALKETRWNRRKASKLLGISYRALLYKMRDAGLPSKKQARKAISGEAEVAGGQAAQPVS